jgi:ribosome biogenesis GTPase
MPDPLEYQGRVIKSFGKRFIVATPNGTFDCELRGRFRLSTDESLTPVAVGDRVSILVENPPYGVIEKVEPRRSKLSRPDVYKTGREQIIVANCDQLIVVSSVAQPRLKTGAVDRLLLVAERNGMDGVVVINKTDLRKNDAVEQARQAYELAGYPVLLTSATENQGIDALRDVVRFKTSIVCGHSGVGKSSLINALQPGLKVATSEVSEATGKGTHTTTTVELHPLDIGGYIADTPGLKVIGLWDLSADELPEMYPEFRPYSVHCRFRNCMHIGEPGCAVTEALNAGRIARERYEGYLRIRESLTRG